MTEARWAEPLGADVVSSGRVEACVIGSGAGGAPVALTLARAGYKVLVLEKGPAYDQRDFVYDEIRSCRRDFFVPDPASDPHVEVVPGQPPRITDKGWTARCVGGGTTQFSGFTYRAQPVDLRLLSWLGPIQGTTLADWPIAWEQLEPYYERAEHALGVSGDATRNPFELRRWPLPLPPLRENGMALLVDEACGKLGLHSYPTARAILSRTWGGRAECRRKALCGSYGCETGAKSSTLAALLPDALATGRCQIRPLCQAVAIETDASGAARAVRYRDARGAEQRVGVAVVVVACGAIESARLLLLSAGGAHPAGIGNHSGQLGRNLMFTSSGGGHAELERADPRMRAIDWSEPFVNRSVQDGYLLERAGKNRRKGGTLNFLLPHANPIYRAEALSRQGEGPLRLWGSALKDSLRHFHREVRVLEFEAFSESLPLPGSFVSLDPEVKDRFGLPAARFTSLEHPIDREGNAEVVALGTRVLDELGGQRIRYHQGQKTHWLQAGTCRFGRDAEHAVLDADCRVFSARNVFVTDGSFMPTSTGVPNTLTIEANAFRVADRIVALGKSHALFRPLAG